MASGKKGAKGNKTAHVLNLLTAPGETAPSAAGETEASSPEAAQPAASRPLLPPILEVAQANDNDLAQQIQQALEEELAPPAEETAPVEEVLPVAEDKPASGGKMSQDEIEAMLASMGGAGEEPVPEQAREPEPVEPEPQPAPPAPAAHSDAPGGKMSQAEIEAMLASMGGAGEEPVLEQAREPEPVEPEPQPAPPAPAAHSDAPGSKMSQDEIEAMLASINAGTPETVPEPAPESEAASEPEPEPAPAPQKPELPPEEDISYVNVMQTLVEEIAPRYIEKFGLCTCKHCEADVKALTLTNLVPKYVVLSRLDRIPMLTVYEGRFNTTIYAQLTRACKIVMDHPHHGRSD